MTEHKILIENEKQANFVVAKVMRLTFLIFTVVYLLNWLGIFIVDPTIMTASYVGSGFLLLLPTLLINVLRQEKPYIKYLNVTVAAAFITLLSITLTYHVVVLYVYPIAIASLYFSKKLNVTATLLTVVGVSLGQLGAFYAHTWQDNNFLTLDYVLLFGVLPRALVLIAIAAIFTMLSGRTTKLLNNLLTAEKELKHSHKEMVMAIADVFDAVSEKRCYRDAMPLEQCFEIIAEGSGQAFEPMLVEVFLDIRKQVERTHDQINNQSGGNA